MTMRALAHPTAYSAAIRVVALVLLFPVAVLPAQSPDVAHTPGVHARRLSVLIGSGLAASNGGATNNALATNAGGLLLAAVELPLRHTAGPARFAIRAESRWSHQSLSTNAGSGLSGDVQTMSAGLLLRVSPRALSGASSRFTPYVLAGAGAARPSTRVSVFIDSPDIPSARFGQTSSEVAATALGGVGAQFRVGFAHLFAEARTEIARLNAGTRRATLGTLGLVLSPSR